MPALSQVVPFVAGLPHLVLRGRGGSFAVDGRRLPYFYDLYNFTWLNERAVEVPLAEEVFAGVSDVGRLLEVGNVMAHYGRRGHVVIDRFEQAPGVRNIDVLDLAEDDQRFEAIVSISTLEHVGVDDGSGDPRRAIQALQLLLSRLAPGGRLLATVPVGYNPTLDAALADGEVPGVSVWGLRREAAGPRWLQVPAREALADGYDFAAKTARGLLVVESI